MAGNITIAGAGAGGTLGVISASGSGLSFLDALYKYANLTLPFSPNDPGLQYTYNNSSLAETVFLYARFFNLLNEPSTGVLVNVGTSTFASGVPIGDCLDVRLPRFNGGAKGDGVTDDTIAIQLALNEAALNASGKTTQVSAGLRVLQNNTAFVTPSTSTPFTGNGSNLTVALPKVTTKGSVLLFTFDSFHWDNPPTVQDSGGNTYVQFVAKVDGEHITYGYWALNNSGGVITATVNEVGSHGNSFIIGALSEVQNLVIPVTLDGTPASNSTPSGAPSIDTGTVTLTNTALDTVFSFVYTDGSTTPVLAAPPGYSSLLKQAFAGDGGQQLIVLATQDITISGSSQNINAPWKLDGTEVGAIGFTVAFQALPLTSQQAITGPTTVCIPFGVNCLVSYQSIDMCDGIWYSQSRRCLLMDNGVTLLIDGSIIKAKESLFAPQLYIDPPGAINFGGRTDGTRTYVLNGFDNLGNPATETYVVGNATSNGSVIWSCLTGGTVTPPFSYPEGPEDTLAPDLDFTITSNADAASDFSMIVVGGQIFFGNQSFPITQQSNLVLNPPSQVYLGYVLVNTKRFSGTFTIIGQDQNGNDVTDVVTVVNAFAATSNLTFSKIYSATQTGAPAGQYFVRMFYYPNANDTNNGSFSAIGRFNVQVGVGNNVTSGEALLGNFPGGGWVIENINSFVPFSQFNNSQFEFPGGFFKSLAITSDYVVDVKAAHSYEGYRNTNISIVGSGQVILNGDWAYRNADQNFGVFAFGSGISHVGFCRFCACDNLTIEGIEIISPSRAAINILHSDSPVINNVFIHDGHGDDNAIGQPYGINAQASDPVDGVINLDFCRNAKVVLNRLYNNQWGGIADWASFQSLVQQNDVEEGRFGYQFVAMTQEFQWDFFETGINFTGTSPVNNEISGNRMINMTAPGITPPFGATSLGYGFGFFDDGGPFNYNGGVGENFDGASGISFHDNVANNNAIDFIQTDDIFFRSLYNNDFESGGNTIINGTQSVSGETPGGTVDGHNTTFTLAHAPQAGTLTLTLNGLLQDPPADYAISGNTITFVTAPPLGSTMLASYQFSVGG